MSDIKLLSRKQVAEALGIHPRTLDRHVRESKFPAPALVCGLIRWKQEDVEEYVRRRFYVARSN